jgi:hypothetical protein
MGLDGEAGLAMRHYFLRGVGVLDDLLKRSVLDIDT